MHTLLFNIAQYSYLEIFIALGLGIAGLPIPDETLMAYAGFLVFQGKLGFLSTIAVAFMGTSCGITVGYVLGRIFGRPLINKYASKLLVSPDDIRDAEKFYNQYGKLALFIGYFVPGVRHLTAIFAGIALMPYRTFSFFAYAGGFLWTVTLVSLGYALGEKWRHIYMYSHRFLMPIVFLSILFLLARIYRTHKK